MDNELVEITSFIGSSRRHNLETNLLCQMCIQTCCLINSQLSEITTGTPDDPQEYIKKKPSMIFSTYKQKRLITNLKLF